MIWFFAIILTAHSTEKAIAGSQINCSAKQQNISVAENKCICEKAFAGCWEASTHQCYEVQHANVLNQNPCGKSKTTRIHGGVSVEDMPYLVTLNKYTEEEWQPHCTGTLIAPDVVLTAAHCFVDCLGFPCLLYPLTAFSFELLHLTETNYRDRIRDIHSIEVNAGYMRKQPSYSNMWDIALVKLKSPFDGPFKMQFPCLPDFNPIKPDLKDLDCIAAGYGSEEADASNKLLKIDLKIHDCRESSEDESSYDIHGYEYYQNDSDNSEYYTDYNYQTDSDNSEYYSDYNYQNDSDDYEYAEKTGEPLPCDQDMISAEGYFESQFTSNFDDGTALLCTKKYQSNYLLYGVLSESLGRKKRNSKYVSTSLYYHWIKKVLHGWDQITQQPGSENPELSSYDNPYDYYEEQNTPKQPLGSTQQPSTRPNSPGEPVQKTTHGSHDNDYSYEEPLAETSASPTRRPFTTAIYVGQTEKGTFPNIHTISQTTHKPQEYEHEFYNEDEKAANYNFRAGSRNSNKRHGNFEKLMKVARKQHKDKGKRVSKHWQAVIM